MTNSSISDNLFNWMEEGNYNVEPTRGEPITRNIRLENSDSNFITGNSIIRRLHYGIELLTSHYNTIANNTISNQYTGIWIIGSKNNVLINNTISNNGWAIEIGASSNTINNNTIQNNYRGIVISYNPNNNIITGNILLANTEWGIYASGDDNLFYLNRFIDNEGQAYDSGTNRWDNGDPAEGGDGGNYWSDYEGEDRGDGIGDIPYDIEGSDNQDNYPWIIQQPDDGVLSDHLLPILIVVIAIVAILVVVTIVRKKRAD